MPLSLDAQYLDTIGMEFESLGLNKSMLSDYLATNLSKYYPKALPFQITRDASVESMVELKRLANARRVISLFTHSKFFQSYCSGDNRNAWGYELVTLPQSIEELAPLIYRLTNAMENQGDFSSERCAVHYHVGFAHNLRLMKKLLAVCLTIDPLLFRLGGMGGLHRGHSNLNAYARPLLNAPAVPVMNTGIDSNRDDDEPWDEDNNHEDDEERLEPIGRRNSSNTTYVQLINAQEALQATTTNQFWANFGVFPNTMGLSKYHPVRYVGCNFYAIPMHGTMEFRHFNQSFNPGLLVAIAKLLRATVEMSTLLTKSEVVEFTPRNPNVELSVDSAQEIMDLLYKFFIQKEIENIPTDSEVQLLMETIEKSSFKELPIIPVRTHNNEFRIPSNLVGKLAVVKNPLMPKQVDIHTIKYSTILGA